SETEHKICVMRFGPEAERQLRGGPAIDADSLYAPVLAAIEGQNGRCYHATFIGALRVACPQTPLMRWRSVPTGATLTVREHSAKIRVREALTRSASGRGQSQIQTRRRPH